VVALHSLQFFQAQPPLATPAAESVLQLQLVPACVVPPDDAQVQGSVVVQSPEPLLCVQALVAHVPPAVKVPQELRQAILDFVEQVPPLQQLPVPVAQHLLQAITGQPAALAFPW
jgi:hypothetical protein